MEHCKEPDIFMILAIIGCANKISATAELEGNTHNANTLANSIEDMNSMLADFKYGHKSTNTKYPVAVILPTLF